MKAVFASSNKQEKSADVFDFERRSLLSLLQERNHQPSTVCIHSYQPHRKETEPRFSRGDTEDWFLIGKVFRILVVSR